MSTQLTKPRAKAHREDEFTSGRHVYEPHRVGLPPMLPYIRELWRRRVFAYYFVSDAVRQAVKSVTSGGGLILNTAFPRTLLPLASVVTAFKRFLPTLAIYVPVFILAGLPFGPGLLWLL